MSGKEKEYDLEVRGRAIGMIEAGMKQKKVAEAVGVSLRTSEYWWANYKKTGSVSKKKRTGRPRVLGGLRKSSSVNLLEKSVKAAENSANECGPRICKGPRIPSTVFYAKILD